MTDKKRKLNVGEEYIRNEKEFDTILVIGIALIFVFFIIGGIYLKYG